MTPTIRNNGDSQLRFSAKTCTIRLVPTSAPSMTASAAEVSIRPCPTNELVSSAVAVLLWIRPVTPIPAAIAVRRLPVLARRILRKFAPYTRRNPVRTMWVPHTSSATADKRASRACMRSAASCR